MASRPYTSFGVLPSKGVGVIASALILCLLSLPTHAAFKSCGPTQDGSFTRRLETCPPVMSNVTAGANVTSSGFDTSVDLDVTTGDLYLSVIAEVTDCAAELPSIADIKAGTGAIYSTSDLTPSASNSFTATGGSASTNYCIWYVDAPSGAAPSLIYGAEAITSVSGSSLITDNSYFIDRVSGSDSNDGTSDATAWKTCAKANSGITASGADLYGKQGQSCETNASLTIDWPCTSGDRCIIDTYHMVSTVETAGTSSDTNPGDPRTTDTSDSERFSFVGDFPTSFVEGNRYAARINVVDPSGYVTIQNINITDSNGRGIEIKTASGCNNIIDKVKIDGTATSGIVLRGCGTNTVKRSQITEGGRCGQRRVDGETTGICDDHPSILAIRNSDDNIITGNYLHRNWGETISAGAKSEDNIISDNILFANRWINLRNDASKNNTFERNLVIGASRQAAYQDWFGASDENTGPCMGVSYENAQYESGYHATGVIFRNNVCIGTGGFMRIAASSLTKADTTSSIGASFLGNTSIYDDYYMTTSISQANDEEAIITVGGIQIQNNIFGALNPSSTLENCSSDMRNIINGDYVVEDYSARVDAWDQTCGEGANSIDSATITFGNSDWTDGSPSNIWVVADFTPDGSSDTNAAGPATLTGLTDDYSETSRANPMGMGAVEN